MFKAAIPILVAICAVPLSAGTISIYASADSRLDQAAPDTPWLADTAGVLDVIHVTLGQERSLIFKFDLGALPAGATITGAKVWLYDTGWDDANGYAMYWNPNSNWSYPSVTLNTFPTDADVLVGSRVGSAGWQYNYWDVDVSSWNWTTDVTQGAATFHLREGYSAGFYNSNAYYSRLSPEPGVHPYLELEYSGNGTGDPQVPEPGSFALLGGGLLGAVVMRVLRTRGASGGTRG